MLRALGVLALLALPVVAADAAPQGGRVVRIERRTSRPLGEPRWCSFQGTATQATCYGPSVQVGETILILTSAEVVGELTVTHVSPDGGCGATLQWDVEGELARPIAAARLKDVATGVIDGGLDPKRAHAMDVRDSPSGRATDQSWSGYDTDGDGTADLFFDQYICDAQGLPSQTMSNQCVETWTQSRRDPDKHRLRLDVVPQC